FTPAEGETILGAVGWKDEKQKRLRALVLTDRAIHVLDEAGRPVLSTPLAYDRENYGSVRVGRLENPPRFVVWYEPSWYRWYKNVHNRPSSRVEYAPPGHEVAHRTIPPRPFAAPSYAQALFGLGTSPAEAAVLIGEAQDSVSGARSHGGGEI